MSERLITAKFGGTSLCDVGQFIKVAKIVKSDPARRFVVASAPGKRNAKDAKVTDMLIACCEERDTPQFASTYERICERFIAITEKLNLNVPIVRELDCIRENIGNKAGYDYIISRGEYLNALLLADYLGYAFIDAAELIFFDENGRLDQDKTYHTIEKALLHVPNAVIPGFYGSLPDGRIKTFSRGGSDITGSIIARGTKSALYENWTDTSGIMMADPRLIPDARAIEKLTYRELREMSYMGANVLHDEAVFPVKQLRIPINVRNTNAPEAKGTMILPETDEPSPFAITGIAGKKDFSVFLIEKSLMNNEVGFVRRVLSVFEEHGISIEHLPTGIDNTSVVVENVKLHGATHSSLCKEITQAASADQVTVINHIALIAIVGRNMQKRRGTAATIMNELGKAGINISMLDQGINEMSIIIGVSNSDYEKTVQLVYDVFVR